VALTPRFPRTPFLGSFRVDHPGGCSAQSTQARLPGPTKSSDFHFGVLSLNFQLLPRAPREGGAHAAASEMQTKRTSKRAFMVFLLLVVVCFSLRILGRFPALQKCAGFASFFGSHPFISLSSSGVI